MTRRVILRTDPIAPIFAVYTADADACGDKPALMWLHAFQTTDARAEWVAAQGYEVIGQ